jgi:hypothetical protein
MSDDKLTVKDQFLQEKVVPLSSRELIEILDEVYPEKSPTREDIGVPLEELWMDAGRRELIRSLRQMLEDS